MRESPSKVVYEDGSETRFGYDVEGNLTAVADVLDPFYYGAFDNLLGLKRLLKRYRLHLVFMV
ncbi:putative deoxyribonuclease RhsC [Pectobacterium polaris]|nr:putative deoxyribonuclease RhsC [Pectobacterium polaris]